MPESRRAWRRWGRSAHYFNTERGDVMATKGQTVFYRPKYKSESQPAIVLRVYGAGDDAGKCDLVACSNGGAESERADAFFHNKVVEGTGDGQFVTSE